MARQTAKAIAASRLLSLSMDVSTASVLLLDGLARNDLVNLRDWYFDWLIASTVVVIVGVALEGPEVFHEIHEVIRGPRKLGMNPVTGLPVSDVSKAWIKAASSIGWVLIVAGVAGEGVFEGYVSAADGRLQTFDVASLIRTQKETALALEESAKVQREAEQLRSENLVRQAEILKLRERLADRTLTPAQKLRITRKLYPFFCPCQEARVSTSASSRASKFGYSMLTMKWND